MEEIIAYMQQNGFEVSKAEGTTAFVSKTSIVTFSGFLLECWVFGETFKMTLSVVTYFPITLEDWKSFMKIGKIII